MSNRVPLRPVPVVVGLLLTTGLLAGCGGDEPEADLPSLDATPSSSASPSSSARASATDSPSGGPDRSIPTAYPDAGLVLTGIPEVDNRRQRAALEAYLSYERGVSKLGRTPRMNDLITANSAGGALQQARDGAAEFRREGTRLSGTVRLDVSLERAGQRIVAFQACEDASDLERSQEGQPAPLEPPLRTRIEVVVTAGDTGWTVTEYDRTGNPC